VARSWKHNEKKSLFLYEAASLDSGVPLASEGESDHNFSGDTS
jgi:hypothetical protein